MLATEVKAAIAGFANAEGLVNIVPMKIAGLLQKIEARICAGMADRICAPNEARWGDEHVTLDEKRAGRGRRAAQIEGPM